MSCNSETNEVKMNCLDSGFKRRVLSQLEVSSLAFRNKIVQSPPSSIPSFPSETRPRQAPKKILLQRASFSGKTSTLHENNDKHQKPSRGRLLDIKSIIKIEDETIENMRMASTPMNSGMLSQALSLNGPKTSLGRSSKLKKKFSEKLFDALSQEDTSQGMTWLPDGKSFVIVNRQYFVDEVLPKYFKEAKFESFLRKLKRWGFKRLPRNVGMDAFYHENFVSDNPDLCRRMRSNSTVVTPRDKKVDTSEVAVYDAEEEVDNEKLGADEEECMEGVTTELSKRCLRSLNDDVGVTTGETSGRLPFDLPWQPNSTNEESLILPTLRGFQASNLIRSLLQQRMLQHQHQKPNMMSSILLASRSNSLPTPSVLGKLGTPSVYGGPQGFSFSQNSPPMTTRLSLPLSTTSHMMFLSKLNTTNMTPKMSLQDGNTRISSESKITPSLGLPFGPYSF